MKVAWTRVPMNFNNCGPNCCGWSDYPIGNFRLPPNTKVHVVKPDAYERDQIRTLQNRERQKYNMVNLKGKRVYMHTKDLMFEEEFHERRRLLKKQGLLR